MRNKLKAQRERFFTQQELADKIGCTAHQISMIETGRSYPSLRLAIKFCNAIQYNVDPTGKVEKAFEKINHCTINSILYATSVLNIPFDTENYFEVN